MRRMQRSLKSPNQRKDVPGVKCAHGKVVRLSCALLDLQAVAEDVPINNLLQGDGSVSRLPVEQQTLGCYVEHSGGEGRDLFGSYRGILPKAQPYASDAGWKAEGSAR